MKKKESLFNLDRTKLIIGTSISQLGSMLFRMALGFWVIIETGDALRSAAIITAGTAASLIFTPISSNIVGNLGKKKVIVITDILSGCIWISAWFLMMATDDFEEKFLIMLATTFLSTAVASLNNLGSQSLLRIMTPDNLLHKLYAFLGFFDNFKMMGVTAISGLVFALIGIEWIVLINAITFGAAIIIEITISMKEVVVREKISLNPIKHYYGFVKGSRDVMKDKKVKALFLLTMGMIFVSVPMFQLSNRFLGIEVLGVDPATFSLYLSIGTAASLIGPMIASFVKKDTLLHMSRYAALFGVLPMIILMAIGTTLYANEVISTFQALLFWLIPFIIMRPIWQITAISRHSTMSILVSKKDIGRVKGMVAFYWELVSIITIPIAGYIINEFGIEYIYISCASMMTIVALMYFSNSTLKESTKRFKKSRRKPLLDGTLAQTEVQQ